jgi:hypothetical protein
MVCNFFDSVFDFLEETREVISDAAEDLKDSMCEKLEEVGDSCIDGVERFWEKIERRGDALLGCCEYEQASACERAACCIGLHDNETFSKCKIKEMEGLKPGDIISVSRGFYEHFGVYVGKDEVIHYTSEYSDIGFDCKNSLL